MKAEKLNKSKTENCRGFVLLLTLVLLIVFSTLAYILSSRLQSRRSRNVYIIDYAKARYACDSAVKYAIATLDEIEPRLIERPNEPDFSDLFQLTEAQYEQFLTEWAEQNQLQIKDSFQPMADVTDFNDVNDFNSLADFRFLFEESNEPDALTVRGPYGPPWPLVAAPIEFEIGAAKVRIEIEDENAKYPLGWALLNDKNIEREAVAGFENFFEWMWSDVNNIDNVAEDIEKIQRQLEAISQVKPFKIKFSSITKLERRLVATARSRTTGTTGTTRTRTVRKTISASQQENAQSVDFAKLFHSSMLDSELLARPTVESEKRNESALKYIATWASTKVNINTAPRHVLEAAFIFGGNEVKIADEVILRRRIKPFENIDDLKKQLFAYSDSVEKCERFITTESTLFTIKITAVCGIAETSTVIAIKKQGNKTTRIAVIST